MLIIGLCGGSGSGKGAVCDAFRSLGIPTIDTDSVYHSLTSGPSPCLEELVLEFGDGILRDGALDRRKLADIVFSEGAGNALARLNAIAHRHILRETMSLVSYLEGEGNTAVVLDAPLLFESGLDRDCDFTVAVIADMEKRIERIMTRDGLTLEEATRRISNQLSDDELVSRVDFVIYNNGSLSELATAVGDIMLKLEQ